MSAVPWVSCIVPAYNAQQYLAQTLDSMLAQTGVSFELIVVDDGSTDDTAAIAASYGPAIRLVAQTNSGPVAARNRGIAESRGHLLTFMDADDLSPSNRFALQTDAFDRDPNLDLCTGLTQNFQGDRIPVGEAIAGFNTDMMVRRAVFDRVGLFQSHLQHAARLEWMLRVRRLGLNELHLPDVLVHRRLHARNFSNIGANESLREHLRVLHATLKQKN